MTELFGMLSTSSWISKPRSGCNQHQLSSSYEIPIGRAHHKLPRGTVSCDNPIPAVCSYSGHKTRATGGFRNLAVKRPDELCLT